jgi:hypothetical protein
MKQVGVNMADVCALQSALVWKKATAKVLGIEGSEE